MSGGASVKVPLLVTHRKQVGYRLSCLFLPQLWAVADRHDQALKKLRQAIQKHFKNVRVSRQTLDERLWLSFAPELRFERVPLGVMAGKRWVEGLFAVAFFSLQDRRYACLPMLDGLVADLGERGLGSDERTERLAAAIQAFLREQRKEQGDAFDPQRYLAAASDELGELSMSLPLAPGGFPFEEGESLFARLRGDIGDGRAEMARVAADLNEQFPDELMSAVSRDELVESLHQSLYRGEPGPVVLVGPRGCGKTALVHGALRRFMTAEAGRDVAQLQKLWHLDPLRVVSGMSVIGQWQRRMEVVLQYLRSRLNEQFNQHGKPDLLYCDNLVALLSVGKSSQNSLTLADVLRPHLEKRHFTLVGEATPEAWQAVQQRDRRFADLFRVVRVDPPHRADAIGMVHWRRAELEQRSRCQFTAPAMAELIRLERRFAGDEVLPGSAVRMLDRLATRHAGQTIGLEEVLAAYTASYRLREKMFSRQVGLPPAEAAAHFAARLIGQAPVRAQLVDVVALVKSGLAAPGKPLSSLLFIGPTGVGKSEAAKLLADYLFEDEGGLVRFDMNEYVDAGAGDRLIGDARRPDGQLTAAVRQRRACVLLLDEIEKAHPSVHDLLLQLLGEGRLTDALGRTTDFSQCVVVMTSNLGAAAVGRNTGFTRNAADAEHTYREAVERFFRPEFLNRIDQIAAFAPLGAAEIASIAQLQIDRLMVRDGFARRMTFLSVSPSSLEQLARMGHDEALGARALKRGIERVLTAPVAQRLASSGTAQPMLLDVDVDASGRLQTRATLLEHATPRPVPLPAEAADAAGHERLLAQAEAMQSAIHDALDDDPPAPVSHALHTLQVRLDPLRDVLSRRSWDLRNRRAGSASPRVRKPQRQRDWRDSLGRPDQNLRHAHDDVREFFEQLHAQSQPLRQVESETVGWALELGLLERRLKALLERGIDRLAIEIAPLQSAAPADAVQRAWADLSGLLSQLDAHGLDGELPPPPHSGVRSFEGVGLREAFQGECGVHLWHLEGERPLPLLVRMHDVPPPGGAWPVLRDAPLPTQIVRLRVEPARPGGHRGLTDLRSGLVRKFVDRLGEDDWRLLMWHGDPALAWGRLEEKEFPDA